MNGVRKRNRVAFTIDSLEINGDTAFVIVSPHVDRMTLRADDLIHHVETRVTQREAWVRHDSRWFMRRVDHVWLFTIAEGEWRSEGGERVARVGPLPLTPGRNYATHYIEAVAPRAARTPPQAPLRTPTATAPNAGSA